MDGVIAITHGSGCGLSRDGDGFELLRRTLTGYARHPNVGGVVAGRTRLRGQPGVRAGRPVRPGPRYPDRAHDHPASGRHGRDHPGRGAGGAGAVAGRGRYPAHGRARGRARPGPELRRLRRVVGRERQPGARGGGGPAGRPPAARPSSARPRRSTAPSICSPAARRHPRSPTGCSIGWPGGSTTRPPTAATWTTIPRRATAPAV